MFGALFKALLDLFGGSQFVRVFRVLTVSLFVVSLLGVECLFIGNVGLRIHSQKLKALLLRLPPTFRRSSQDRTSSTPSATDPLRCGRNHLFYKGVCEGSSIDWI